MHKLTDTFVLILIFFAVLYLSLIQHLTNYLQFFCKYIVIKIQRRLQSSLPMMTKILLIGCFLRHTIQFHVLCVNVSSLNVCCFDCILSISSL